MRKLFSWFMKLIFIALLTIIWVLLYRDGILQKFDAGQFALLGMLTFTGLFATAVTWYIDYEANKQPVKYQCCNCEDVFEANEISISEDVTLCHKCEKYLTNIIKHN